MKYKPLSRIHSKSMQDHEYRVAYESEVGLERLQRVLQELRGEAAT